MITINIAKNFSDTPGGRYISQGDHSGEKFRKEILDPLFEDTKSKTKIQIILDGCYGFPTSFTSEAFGGLAKKRGKDVVLKRLEFVSKDEPMLIKEILSYIKNA